MNEIVNRFLLTGDQFMPEVHLKQPRFTNSACRPFTENKEYKTLKKQDWCSRNKLDKACFQHDIAYGAFKDLTKSTITVDPNNYKSKSSI